MIDYSKMRASICTYDDMYREMEQGVSRALTEYIIQMAEPFEAGGVLYVDRKAVDRCARRMFSSRKQERSRRIESERKLEEMEKRIAQDTKAHSQTVSMLNGRIAELSRQCSETVEGIGDEQPNSGASTSKAGLRKELDDARKEAGEAPRPAGERKGGEGCPQGQLDIQDHFGHGDQDRNP